MRPKPIENCLDLADQLLDERLSKAGRDILRALVKQLVIVKMSLQELEYDLERAHAKNPH